jgi:hypothetical protein
MSAKTGALHRAGKVWRVSIFSPDSQRPLPDSPSTLEKSPAEELLRSVTRAAFVVAAMLAARRAE